MCSSDLVTFTFPHIGNTGITPEDDETATPAAAGMVVKWDPTEPSNWRATGELTEWLQKIGRIGIGGIDTRRLTRAIRQQGAPHVALAHDPEGRMAWILSRIGHPEFPVPIGIFRSVERPIFESAVHAQVDAARAKSGAGDLEKLLNAGDTWTVG